MPSPGIEASIIEGLVLNGVGRLRRSDERLNHHTVAAKVGIEQCRDLLSVRVGKPIHEGMKLGPRHRWGFVAARRGSLLPSGHF
jgi:hypothetical protein